MSKRVEWSSKLEVGVQRIDYEHRIFADLINELSNKVDRGEQAISLSRTIREIMKYADFHFLSEENVMEEYSYPGMKEHVALHRELHAQLLSTVLEHAEGAAPAEKLVNFLAEWFVAHTGIEDARLALYCHQQDELNQS